MIVQVSEDSNKPPKLLMLGELSEVHIPSKETHVLKTLVMYRKALRNESTAVKNMVHAILAMHGVVIHETDIFGKRVIRKIEGCI